MINRLLQKDPAGRARKLRLRTYAVICLNEECGVLEWVQVGDHPIRLYTNPLLENYGYMYSIYSIC